MEEEGKSDERMNQEERRLVVVVVVGTHVDPLTLCPLFPVNPSLLRRSSQAGMHPLPSLSSQKEEANLRCKRSCLPCIPRQRKRINERHISCRYCCLHVVSDETPDDASTYSACRDTRRSSLKPRDSRLTTPIARLCSLQPASSVTRVSC